MSRREDIETVIWQDPDFDALSLEAALLYLWSFTNPRCGMAGIYKVSRRQLCEGRLSEEQIDAALDELRDARFLFYRDGVLWVRTRVKHLRTKTTQIAKSIRSDVEKLDPRHPLVNEFLSTYLGHGWLGPLRTLTRSSSEGQNNGLVEPKERGSPEGHSTLQGKGKGSGKGKGKGEGKNHLAFEEWLEHYRTTTGHSDVRGSRTARDEFAARRQEFSLEELKLATVGCHGDEFCRQNGHDVPETILRASKVQRYIQLARRGGKGRGVFVDA